MTVNKNAYILHLDLDGVLADFQKAINQLIGGYDNEKCSIDVQYRKNMWNAVAEYQKAGSQFWYDLDVMPDAYELWNYVKKYEPQILTAAGNPAFNAGQQKLEWVPEHFALMTKVNVVRKSSEKAAFAAHNHILIDDMIKSIDPWKAAGGIGILHTSAKDTIKQLKKLGL